MITRVRITCEEGVEWYTQAEIQRRHDESIDEFLRRIKTYIFDLTMKEIPPKDGMA